MDLESYFEFAGEDNIRIAGTRIGIEFVVRDYLAGACPEEIVLHYPTLSLEQVHATITYYLANRNEIHKYLELVKHRQYKTWQEEQGQPSNFVHSLRQRLEKQRQLLHEERTLPASMAQE